MSRPPVSRIDWTLFVTLFREEWRLHARLFGGFRFALFPVMIAGIVAAGALAMTQTGRTTAEVISGLHVLIFAFGLYSGTAGFAGSDMLENVIGELSLILSSSATLPVSRRRLLGIFLLKDGLYYGFVIVLPAAIGSVPLFGFSPGAIGAALGLWLSLSVVFGVGMILTVAAIAIRTRGVPGWLIGLGIGAGVVVAWYTQTYGTIWSLLVPARATPLTVLGLVFSMTVVGLTALMVYDPTYGRPSRTAADRFAAIDDALPGSSNGLVAKTILDLGRSSGGFWKPFVSSTILLVLIGALVSVVKSITGIAPAPGIFFGGVLGLSAFTTYNWLTQFDSVDEYLAYPVAVESVFRAKRTAFILVGAPTVALPYLAALIWFDASLIDAVVGAVLLAGYGLYYYGLTVFLAGFDPNEFLFDAVRFATFTLGVSVVLVPTLVAGFVSEVPSPTLAGGLALAALIFGAIGQWLSSAAGPRWDRRYQDG
ncbi:MAG: hypothetical protein U5K37_00980 [Natrialbaceae archaeon]|nr:hypothetical protein [Natrialbaceae archaeon]